MSHEKLVLDKGKICVWHLYLNKTRILKMQSFSIFSSNLGLVLDSNSVAIFDYSQWKLGLPWAIWINLILFVLDLKKYSKKLEIKPFNAFRKV